MTTPAVDRVMVDTNVLLAASDEGRAEHDDAVAALTAWPATGIALYTSGQILREYLAVATRPVSHNGLGMAQPSAVANVRMLRARLQLLGEDRKVADRLVELLDEIECTGKQVHDANVVATMLVHGVATVATGNLDDFARFGDHISAIRPA